MTLYELSIEYHAQAEVLRQRILQLKHLEANADEEEARLLHDRIRILSSMWRDTRDIAVLTEHYYERRYRRNARYII